MNLNGILEDPILDMNISKPVDFKGDIFVPFPVESHLSDVAKAVGAENHLWYK